MNYNSNKNFINSTQDYILTITKKKNYKSTLATV